MSIATKYTCAAMTASVLQVISLVIFSQMNVKHPTKLVPTDLTDGPDDDEAAEEACLETGALT